ncbi:MAG TPA: hypothetical protein V6C97_07895 [Oculatellaceae cyanobacterium]
MYTVYTAFSIWASLVVLFAVTAFFRDRRRKRKFDDKSSMLGALPGFAVITFIIAALGGYGQAYDRGEFLPTKTVVGSIRTLVAMRSVDSFSGSIFLGCGTVDGVTVYHLYVRNADGSMSPEQVYASPSVHIVEDKNLRGEGFWRVIQTVRDNSGPRAKWALISDDGVVSSYNEFDVPVGTVVQEFSVK